MKVTIENKKGLEKDLTYIHEMLKDLGNAEKLADVKKSFYKKAVDEGNGDLFISELIKKD